MSLKFLLPKLANEKQLTIERYENALRAIGDARLEVTGLLRAHIATHRRDLNLLSRAAADAARAK